MNVHTSHVQVLAQTRHILLKDSFLLRICSFPLHTTQRWPRQCRVGHTKEQHPASNNHIQHTHTHTHIPPPARITHTSAPLAQHHFLPLQNHADRPCVGNNHTAIAYPVTCTRSWAKIDVPQPGIWYVQFDGMGQSLQTMTSQALAFPAFIPFQDTSWEC